MAGPQIQPVLAIETATTVARVAVIDARTGVRLAAAEALAERHSSNLLRLCVETTQKAGVEIQGLGGIACGAGPGSFTGLRVGLAVAKGLAMPTDIPLVLVSSLQALAWDMRAEAGSGEWLLPCLDAGKGQVFAALFQVGNSGGRPGDGDGEGGGVVFQRGDAWSLLPELLLEQLPTDGAAIVVAGPGAARYRAVLEAAPGQRIRIVDVAGPSADAVATLALPRFARGDVDDLGTAVPAYGRAPDITKPKPRPPR